MSCVLNGTTFESGCFPVVATQSGGGAVFAGVAGECPASSMTPADAVRRRSPPSSWAFRTASLWPAKDGGRSGLGTRP